MPPKISVIIPNYNRTTVLQQAIKSVLNQSYQNFEILIVDDASTINPSSYIDTFEDQRIKLIQLQQNGGAAKARNIGATKANGKYIAFLDSDDEWLSNHLERRLAILQNENIDGCYGAVTRLKDGLMIDKPPVRLPSKQESMVSYLLSGTLRAATPSLVMKRQAFLEIKFDKELIIHEDYDMVIRFGQRYTWACDTVPSVIVHLSNTGLSGTFDFNSSILFLKKHAKDLDFKWLMFYCLRKISIAHEKKEKHWVKSYSKILKNNLPRTNAFFKLNYYLFEKFNALYLFFFQASIALAYNLRSFHTRLSKSS